MADSNDALKAVEALCRLLEEMLKVPGMGPPEAQMFAYRIKGLRDGCAQLRNGYRTLPHAATILEGKLP